ncbi:unnamed protein product [Heligmosomoides polygyrus]|uniref:G_PROTEIN_RECEP_F1_2 domain-containing protein n=1 Tax=Heligmosomoides polygyrus TaxID=6339 RepID=A0A183FF80_HELPZ|nr:unnamed protein product [Heligmosomoides polygyrus]
MSTTWETLARLAPTIVPIIILNFEVLGIFGNVNLIIATIRNRNLQTKHGFQGILLALTSFYQLMCLFGELINAVLGIRGGEIKRDECFILMTPYLVFSIWVLNNRSIRGRKRDQAVRRRINTAWLKWRESIRILCDRGCSRTLKGRVYRTVVKPAFLYGSECWALGKAQEWQQHATEMRMLRWACG